MDTATSTPNGDVLERIRKLLALAADSGATEHEAALALARAQALLRKHDLEIADIERLTGKPKATVTEQREPRTTTHLREVSLAAVISRANRCRLLKDRDTLYFIGREANIEATKLALRWISQQLLQAHGRAVAGRRIDSGVAARVAFLEGAVSRVAQRLREAQQAAERDEAGVTALVLVRDREVNDYIANKYGSRVKARKTTHYRRGDRNAREAGFAAGGDVSLAPQAGLGAPRTALRSGR